MALKVKIPTAGEEGSAHSRREIRVRFLKKRNNTRETNLEKKGIVTEEVNEEN